MVTHEHHSCETYHIDPFWDDEFKRLDYKNEPFNDPASVKEWLDLGFLGRITGDMCDMRATQPSWNHRVIEYFQNRKWKDIGTSYYRMKPGTVMPMHSDLYRAYIKRFGLENKKHKVRRALILLEDWKQGHYLDCMGRAFVHWRAGDVVEWSYDTPHTAANVGFEDRYTLQITGHL